jgi:uncharacterized repeat protein (TIGR03803 family)
MNVPHLRDQEVVVMRRPAPALAMLAVALAVAVPGAAAASQQVLHSFAGADGVSPSGLLVDGGDGFLYGSTFYGGAVDADNNPDGYGTLYRFDRSGRFETVYRFNRVDGERPNGLVPATDGFFYGTTSHGGDLDPASYSGGSGTLFRLTSAGALTVLHRFMPIEGMWPSAAPTFGPDGALYGTARSDSTYPTYGTIWRWTPGGGLTVVHEFTGPDGNEPLGPLTLARDGNLYGTTNQGGAYGCGTIFRLTPPDRHTVLHSFGFGDGCQPKAGVIQARDGNLYGTTETGGSWGTVFRADLAGNVTTLHAFGAYGETGQRPLSELLEAADGFLYGTTKQGGPAGANTSGRGVVFRLSLGGSLEVVHAFSGPDGSTPWNGVTQWTDGALYGATLAGGAFGRGVVYRLDPAATATATLASLTLSQAVVRSGGLVAATVRLSSPAPAGGAQVALASSDPRVATVPASVTVTAGATSARFDVATKRNRTGTVTVSATYGGSTLTAQLTVTRS